MNQEQIENYADQLLKDCLAKGDITQEEYDNLDIKASALSETEYSIEDCEEIGSSDSHYHRMSILQALNKPNLYSKETNKYNEMFRN